MNPHAVAHLNEAQLSVLASRDRLDSSGDLPYLTMDARKHMLKSITLIEHDIAEIRRLLK